MLISIGLVSIALRAGLAMRRRRLRGIPPDSNLLKRHLALAKPGVFFVCFGFVGGGISSLLFRGWQPLQSLHGIVGLLVVILFSLTAYLGKRSQRGEGDPALHGLFGVLGVLVALLAGVAGFVLLP
jgi:hypothetical protein